MSRHNKVKQYAKEGMDEVYNNDAQDDDNGFNDDEEELIQQLYEDLEMKASRTEIIKCLDSNDWNPDTVFDALYTKISNREAKKNPSQQQQQSKNQGQKQSQQPQKQPQQQQLQQQSQLQKNLSKEEDEKSKQSEEQLIKSNIRKGSQSEKLPDITPIRKQSTNEALPEMSLKNDNFKYEKNLELCNKPYPAIKVDPALTQKQPGTLVNINMVIAGHVDSGKSTLAGHLSQLMNIVDQKTMHKLEMQAKEEGKESFKYAWAQDEFKEERQRGVTMDVGFKTIRTKTKQITLLDSPGHKDFVPNMISGASQADYAILVIDCIDGAFISGFSNGGQTKEHSYLLKALGISQLIVTVNKMDQIDWSEMKYKSIVDQLKDFLVEIGFDQSILHFIPISAFQGINIVDKPKLEKMKWYQGPCLMEILENLQPPKRSIEKPLRFNIYNCIQAKNVKGILLQGKLEGGIIQQKKKYVIQPYGIVCQVKEISQEGNKLKFQTPGENIDVTIIIKNDNDIFNIQSGDVLCPMEYPIPITNQLVIQFATFDLQCPIIKGSQVVVYINTCKTPGIIKKITRLIDSNTGNTLKANPRCINKNQCAEILLQLEKNVCAEIFTNFQVYGRVILREKFETLGVGIIKEIK